MYKIKTFIRESYNELLHKVSWPKYAELQNSAILVLVASIIFALVVGIIDYVFENIMEFIYEEI